MPDSDITRAQARERARLLRVRSYEVDLDFTRGPGTFGSVSLIRFDCREPGSVTHADLIAAAVHEITLNGVALDPRAAWVNGRITLPGLAARNELRVAADCSYTTSGTGMHRADAADGSVHIYAKLAPAYARTAYACFDQPDLKAVFTFRVTAPAHWTVLSNQGREHTERPFGDCATVGFAPTPPLPTFTTTVVAGDYHVVTAPHTTPDGQEIPLELACRASLVDRLDSEELFGLVGRGLDYYTRWLGAPYPFAKYGQVFVPEFPHGASEDAGCVLISERLLFPASEASPALTESRTGVLLHEMAHMWFGDCATQEWWDDLWLSESFADYCQARAQAGLGLYPDAWPVMSVKEKIPAFADDRLPSAHPVASGAATVSEAIATFDGITYAKGAAVLRQLSAQVGEEAFTAGLRAYLAGHAYGNARLADLVAAVEAAAGKDLAAWSKAWLQTAGPNILRCEFAVDAAGRFTEFAVVQEATQRHPVLRSHRVTIGLYQRSGDRLTRAGGAVAGVTGARTPVPSLLGSPRPDLILLNDDDTGYVIVRFDPLSLETVLSSVGGLPGLPARAVCWNAVIDMVREAELSVPAFAAMLARAMPAEPSLPVLSALRAQAGWLIARFAGASEAARARTLLDTAAAAVPGLAPDADAPDAGSRWTALLRLAAAGEADDARIDAELARDPSDAGRRNAAACRAAIPGTGHKEAAWRLMTDASTGAQTITAVADGFMQPEHADLLAPYADRYLAEIGGLWRTRGAHMRVHLANVLFPYPGVTTEFLTRIDGFLAAGRTDPDLARIVLDHRDTAGRALRARAL